MLYTSSNYQSLRDRAIKLNSLKDSSYKNYKNAEIKFTESAQELLVAKEKLLVQEASIKVLREIIDIMSREFIDQIADLITYALQTIFHDKDYSIKILLKESRNTKQADIILVSTDEEGNTIESPVPDNCGGGISAVIGLVMQIFFIQYNKLNKVLIMDEALSQISADYIPTTMKFLKMLSEQRGFKFLLISHDSKIIKHADIIYKMEMGNLREIDMNEGEY
jgi:hypothetical protein